MIGEAKKITAVIFDMDGVIFDTESLWKKAFLAANKKFEVDISEEYRQGMCGKNEKLVRDELRVHRPNLDVDAYRDFMLESVNHDIRVGDFKMKPFFKETIDFLKSKGIKIALATSSHKARAEMLFKLKEMEIARVFDAAIYAEDALGKSKPDPYMFLEAAKKLGQDPSNSIVVEDSINGIEAAVRGCFVPVMAVDLIPPNSFAKEHAHIIGDLSGLIEMLKR